jgi:uncharacterized protein (TIGR02453 family)
MKQVLDFLSQLGENNNREWFNGHKQAYESARTRVGAVVSMVIPELAKFDETLKYVAPKDCIFRIYKDVRFSKDKLPYKTNMGAWITGAGRKSSGPGYYIHVQPGGSFLAAGVYMPDPLQLKKIRNEIYYNVAEFKAILNEKKLKKYSAGLSDMDKGKMAPRDYPKDFPDMDLLKYKHYTLSYPMRDEMVASDHFTELALLAFKTMFPFNSFLKRALEG